jgi:serine protease Do
MKQLIILIGFLFLLPTYSLTHPHQDNLNQTQERLIQTADYFSKTAEKVKPAVVYIQVKKKSKREVQEETTSNSSAFAEFFRNEKKKSKDDSFFSDDTTFGSGSGFIIDQQGYILTNNHVIADAVDITVTLSDKTSHKARIVGLDKATDVGLIQIDSFTPPLPTVSLGDSDNLKTGEWALAIGLPYENIQTVTAGIISATGRSSIGVSDYESFIQTDAAINQGNSGGPLVNIYGEVIGINTAFLTQTGGYTGIGFAIPVNIAKKVTQQLMLNGEVTRAWLGVGLRDVNTEQLLKQNIPTTTRAALIVNLRKDSPAEKAGLQQDDIITGFNETPIAGAADLRNKVSLSAPESVVQIEYFRDSLKYFTNATLGTLK